MILRAPQLRDGLLPQHQPDLWMVCFWRKRVAPPDDQDIAHIESLSREAVSDFRVEAKHVPRQIEGSDLPAAVARQLDHADAASENPIKTVG